MDTLNTIASSTDTRSFEDALKVLGRVADAFDNPCLHKTDRELLYVVNVVKSRHLLPSLSSEESDTTYGSYGSSFDLSSGSDEDVELVELGDVGVWEHASSYPYASRRSERMFRQDDGTYDVNKMLLTSSPLDRLDRLARMELKKTGWFERVNRWTIVEMGLQGANVATSTPKTPSKKTGDSGQRSSTTPRSERKSGSDEGIAPSPPATESDCFLGDFSRLSQWTTSGQGRLGRAVRNFVRRMRRQSSRSRSDVSAGSGWTFA